MPIGLIMVLGMIPILNTLPDQEQSIYLAVRISWSDQIYTTQNKI